MKNALIQEGVKKGRKNNMAYMRGEYYIWSDGTNIHFQGSVPHCWSFLPCNIFDALVVMRFTELIKQKKKLKSAINKALEYQGNFGCDALCRILGEKDTKTILKNYLKKNKKKGG